MECHSRSRELDGVVWAVPSLVLSLLARFFLPLGAADHGPGESGEAGWIVYLLIRSSVKPIRLTKHIAEYSATKTSISTEQVDSAEKNDESQKQSHN